MINGSLHTPPGADSVVGTARGYKNKKRHAPYCRKPVAQPLEPRTTLGRKGDKLSVNNQSRHVRFADKIECHRYQPKEPPHSNLSADELIEAVNRIHLRKQVLHAKTGGFQKTDEPCFDQLTVSKTHSLIKEMLGLRPNASKEEMLKAIRDVEEMQEEQLTVLRHDLIISP